MNYKHNQCRQLHLVEVQKEVFIYNGKRARTGEAVEEIPENINRSALLADLMHHLYMRFSWLRHCATSRKFAGSIPDGVIGIFLT